MHYLKNQKGALMPIVIIGLGTLLALFVVVFVLTRSKNTFTAPNLSTQGGNHTQQTPQPLPTQSTNSATASGRTNSTNDSITKLQNDLNNAGSAINNIDQGSSSVLGIATSL